jgi:hypothetical protein
MEATDLRVRTLAEAMAPTDRDPTAAAIPRRAAPVATVAIMAAPDPPADTTEAVAPTAPVEVASTAAEAVVARTAAVVAGTPDTVKPN